MLEILDVRRNTRQGPLGSKGNDNPTIQQLMETVSALQEAMTTSKAEQERFMAKVRAEQLLRQDQLIAEIDVSRASNDELRKTNDDMMNCVGVYNSSTNALQENEARSLNYGLTPYDFQRRSWTLSYQLIS